MQFFISTFSNLKKGIKDERRGNNMWEYYNYVKSIQGGKNRLLMKGNLNA